MFSFQFLEVDGLRIRKFRKVNSVGSILVRKMSI